MSRILRILTIVTILGLSGCSQAVTIKTPLIIQYKTDLMIKLMACDFITQSIGDGVYIVKWNCPWH